MTNLWFIGQFIYPVNISVSYIIIVVVILGVGENFLNALNFQVIFKTRPASHQNFTFFKEFLYSKENAIKQRCMPLPKTFKVAKQFLWINKKK